MQFTTYSKLEPIPKDQVCIFVFEVNVYVLKLYDLVQLAQAIVEPRDRSHHLKTYKNCFPGTPLVSVLS